MNFKWLKQMMPRGLYGRGAMILLLPIVSMQLVVSVVFIQRHFERVTQQLTGSMLLELQMLDSWVDSAPDAKTARDRAAALAAPLALSVTLPSPVPEFDGTPRRFYDFTGIVVTDQLKLGLYDLQAVDLSDGGWVRLWLGTRFGSMEVSFPRDRASASNPHQLLVLMVAVGLLMTLIAYLFLRNQLRPIRRLAVMAEAFGKGQNVTYRISGATEVRSAGAAFLDMRARIERNIEQRTMMLSAISHDLRTPLTRLRLGLSMMPQDPEYAQDVTDMERDVDEMGRLIDAFLDFSRRDAQAAPAEDVDLGQLVREAVNHASRGGRPVELRDYPQPGALIMHLRADDIRRAVDNLIGNALRYGDRAVVTLVASERTARVSVEDAGPGIAPDRHDEALRPFTRLDPSRNQDRGQGVGLGLSIALDIVRSHGGNLYLRKSAELGGLWAEITLPR